MATRRGFLRGLGLGAVGVAALGGQSARAQADLAGRDLYELRRYHLRREHVAQFDAYLSEALLPALKALGVGPIGVFAPTDDVDPYRQLVLTHTSPETVGTAAALVANPTFAQAAAPYLDLPPATPLYERIDSSLLVAFAGFPRVQAPDLARPRLFELRCYESHNERSAATKIRMFEEAEIAIFERTGLPPVFFGQSLIGNGLPNLTYLLAFDDQEARRRGWGTFIADAEWKELSARPEYADSAIVSRITSWVLSPVAGSEL
ncbi:MAG TPA: NIPSNAP family containing protein [Armatimonadetes bacterium]|nr:NIPSNAP family containing protein [Armatimonadota bacterium]